MMKRIMINFIRLRRKPSCSSGVDVRHKSWRIRQAVWRKCVDGTATADVAYKRYEADNPPKPYRLFSYRRAKVGKYRYQELCPWGSIFVLCLIAGLGQVPALAQEQALTEDNQAVEPADAKVDQASFEKWKNLSPEERERLKKRYELLKNMPVQERQAFNENLKRFKNLPPEKQEKLRKNWRRLNNLSAQERQTFQNNYKRWQGMSPDKKKMLRQRYDKFSQMSQKQRQEFSGKQKKWQGLAPAERKQFQQKNFMDRGVQKRRSFRPEQRGGRR